METRLLPCDEVRIAVHVHGRGPLCVLLHGYPLDHRMWLDTLRSPLAAQRTLVAIDLRGHGQSPFAGDAVHTMDLLANDVQNAIKTLGDEPADVVGLSMGGYVALALVAAAPELVRSLVLSNTKATADSAAAQQARQAAIDTVVKDGRRAIATAMLPKLLAPGADALLQARVQSMIEETATETIVADLRGLAARPDRSDLLARIAVPTLAVVGEHDAITPVADAEFLATHIPGGRMVVVPGAGHLTPMEAPAAFAAAVGGFWAGL